MEELLITESHSINSTPCSPSSSFIATLYSSSIGHRNESTWCGDLRRDFSGSRITMGHLFLSLGLSHLHSLFPSFGLGLLAHTLYLFPTTPSSTVSLSFALLPFKTATKLYQTPRRVGTTCCTWISGTLLPSALLLTDLPDTLTMYIHVHVCVCVCVCVHSILLRYICKIRRIYTILLSTMYISSQIYLGADYSVDSLLQNVSANIRIRSRHFLRYILYRSTFCSETCAMVQL